MAWPSLHLVRSLPGLTRQSIVFGKSFTKKMDARVKPGHDELRHDRFPKREV